MLKNILNLGEVLNKKTQKSINGGFRGVYCTSNFDCGNEYDYAWYCVRNYCMEA